MKTQIDIIDDLYALLDVPEVYAAMISGDVFPAKKPDNYRGECIVINSLPITGEQLQRNVSNVNIHVPNLKLTINGQPDNSQPNRQRIKAISSVVIPILSDALINNTVTAIESVSMMAEDELNEHFLNIRVATRSVNL